MLVTNLKARRSNQFFKMQELHSEERPQQWREGGTHTSVLGMGERREEDGDTFVLGSLSPSVLG
jgi:hypothetical protein